ncbi:hypothetical protein TSOC_013125, partial [Tetrabaena socialis]
VRSSGSTTKLLRVAEVKPPLDRQGAQPVLATLPVIDMICRVLSVDLSHHPRHFVLHVWDGTDALPLPLSYTSEPPHQPPQPQQQPQPQQHQQPQRRHSLLLEVLRSGGPPAPAAAAAAVGAAAGGGGEDPAHARAAKRSRVNEAGAPAAAANNNAAATAITVGAVFSAGAGPGGEGGRGDGADLHPHPPPHRARYAAPLACVVQYGGPCQGEGAQQQLGASTGAEWEALAAVLPRTEMPVVLLQQHECDATPCRVLARVVEVLHPGLGFPHGGPHQGGAALPAADVRTEGELLPGSRLDRGGNGLAYTLALLLEDTTGEGGQKT